MPSSRLSDIIHGKRGITADTALRLSKYFGNSAQFWLNRQSQYDLQVAEQANKKIDEIMPMYAFA
ncbi:HigA family addiction module antitoxin [Faucicola boevrei]|uniref:HigA family addiction module antitoxin n=1 Tax=Faucicola boevrei TaxID=346665 RepID=UPI000684F7C0|nr:HigA family addiction module antitoxin [Moraxella boevrei]